MLPDKSDKLPMTRLSRVLAAAGQKSGTPINNEANALGLATKTEQLAAFLDGRLAVLAASNKTNDVKTQALIAAVRLVAGEMKTGKATEKSRALFEKELLAKNNELEKVNKTLTKDQQKIAEAALKTMQEIKALLDKGTPGMKPRTGNVPGGPQRFTAGAQFSSTQTPRSTSPRAENPRLKGADNAYVTAVTTLSNRTKSLTASIDKLDETLQTDSGERAAEALRRRQEAYERERRENQAKFVTKKDAKANGLPANFFRDLSATIKKSSGGGLGAAEGILGLLGAKALFAKSRAFLGKAAGGVGRLARGAGGGLVRMAGSKGKLVAIALGAMVALSALFGGRPQGAGNQSDLDDEPEGPATARGAAPSATSPGANVAAPAASSMGGVAQAAPAAGAGAAALQSGYGIGPLNPNTSGPRVRARIAGLTARVSTALPQSPRSAPPSTTGRPSGMSSALSRSSPATKSLTKTLGKGLGKLLGPISYILVGLDCYAQLEELYGKKQLGLVSEAQFERGFVSILAGGLGGVAGAIVIGQLGATLGGTAGAFVGGVGAVPGAIIGGFAGSAAGFLGGEKMARWMAETIYDRFFKNKEKRAPTIRSTPFVGVFAGSGHHGQPAFAAPGNASFNRGGGDYSNLGGNGRTGGTSRGSAPAGTSGGSGPGVTSTAAPAGLMRPTTGAITGAFGDPRRARNGGTRGHQGVDMRAAIGTPIYSSADGVVEWSHVSRTNGGQVISIRHDNGYTTRYMHLSSRLVQKDQRVTAGQRIGLSGDSGSPGQPHLHYEVWRGGRAVNPASVQLSPMGAPAQAAAPPRQPGGAPPRTSPSGRSQGGADLLNRYGTPYPILPTSSGGGRPAPAPAPATPARPFGGPPPSISRPAAASPHGGVNQDPLLGMLNLLNR